jgi:hypothetical protein
MMTTEFPTKSNQCLTAATTEPTTATIPLTAHKAPALSASLASLTSTDILTSSKANGGLIINQPKSNPAMNNYTSLDQTSSSSSSHAHDVIRSSTKPMHPSAQMVGGQLKISPTSELQNNINQISNQHQRQGHPQHQQQQQQHGNEFLNQLSEVAVKRLDSGLIQPGGSSNSNNNSSSKSNNMKMATSPRSSTSTNRLNGVTHSKKRKNRNSSEAMFGNCLHPHPDESNPISSATTKKKSTKPKRDRSHLRKGKWTVSYHVHIILVTTTTKATTSHPSLFYFFCLTLVTLTAHFYFFILLFSLFDIRSLLFTISLKKKNIRQG